MASVGLAVATAAGQVVDPYYECAYRVLDLGTPPGVPGRLGGLTFDASGADTLLLGGWANHPDGAIYAVPLVRDAEGHVVGFGADATPIAAAPNIDGGLCYGPDGVLFFSRYNMNHVGQIRPGSDAPDKDVDLDALGYAGSVGALMFVPPGFPGEGRLKIAPYTASRWYDATVSPDGLGTFDISPAGPFIPIGGGPEGIVYVEAGATLFPGASVLVSEYASGAITSFEIDGNGDPVLDTRRVFISDLTGAEGGARDPVTGDFLFSTFGGGNRILVVTGFDPACDANYNADCVVNTLDVLAFLSDWAAGDPRADFNADGAVNTLDVLAFLNAWSAGC